MGGHQKIADRWNSSTPLSALRSATGWTSPKPQQRSKLKGPTPPEVALLDTGEQTVHSSLWWGGIQGWKRDKQNWELSENKATYIPDQKWIIHSFKCLFRHKEVPILNSQLNSSMKCHFRSLKQKQQTHKVLYVLWPVSPVVDSLKVNCSKGASIKWLRRPQRGRWGLL